jgi:aryl-alcohol dehydrogenase-like predicted oxidoreductase/predicted kinase
MRLTDPAVLAAAVAGGVTLLDTADAYGNEALIARAMTGRGRGSAPPMGGAQDPLLAAPVTIVTKGGLTRPDGGWVPNGRARHLAAAARASRERLGGDPLALYLLHAIDPAVPLATSVRALARLVDDGVARSIGLSNVNVAQLEQALAIAPALAAVEIELSPWRLDAVRGGVIAACVERGLRVLAHRPLGGPAGVRRAARDPVLRAQAARLGVTPAEVVLAWLRTLAPPGVITTLPGATRLETVASAIRGQQLALDDDARAALTAHFLDVARPGAATGGGAEVVMLLGMPAAGKSTLAAEYAARGYVRLNRDERGGTLLELARAVDDALAGGTTRVVVDNTYPTRASRAPISEVARRHGATLRAVVVAPPIELAQAFGAARALARTGRLDDPKEILPGAQFRWRRAYEPPRTDEGFAAIDDHVPARPQRGTRPGLIVELDGVVWRGRPNTPDEIELVPDAAAGLAAWRDRSVAGVLWRPGAAPEAIAALAARLGALCGIGELRACVHPAGPPRCWCRKPLPGLALALARDLDLDLARSIHLGRGPADRGFAVRAGMQYTTTWPRSRVSLKSMGVDVSVDGDGDGDVERGR